MMITEFDDISQPIMTGSGVCFRLNSPTWTGNRIIRNMKLYLNSQYIHENNVTMVNLNFEEKRNRNNIFKLSPFAMTGDKIKGVMPPGVSKYKIQLKTMKKRNRAITMLMTKAKKNAMKS